MFIVIMMIIFTIITSENFINCYASATFTHLIISAAACRPATVGSYFLKSIIVLCFFIYIIKKKLEGSGKNVFTSKFHQQMVPVKCTLRKIL